MIQFCVTREHRGEMCDLISCRELNVEGFRRDYLLSTVAQWLSGSVGRVVAGHGLAPEIGDRRYNCLA